MTREEERYKEARLHQMHNPIINHGERSLKDIQLSAYVSGAEWADSHPSKGLVDIKKVCDWIDNHIWGYIETGYLSDFTLLKSTKFPEMLEDLCKAMEE